MRINIKNCNNIDSGYIDLNENELNVKYAINGTGKSTISKALEASIKHNDSEMKSLLPFKYYDNQESISPEVVGTDEFKNIAIFNEKYVEEYVFQPNELIKNSFEIFIKTSKYQENTKKIEKLLQNINITFAKHEELDNLIDTFKQFIEGFGKSKKGYAESGSIAKGIGKGNKIENIPKGLESYSIYLKDKNNVRWLKWQMDGKSYLDLDIKCPYCANEVEENRKKTILKVGDEYNSNSIQHLVNMLNILDMLNPYFNNHTSLKIREITQNATEITDVQVNYLLEIKNQVESFLSQLMALKNIGFHSLKYSDKIEDELKGYIIDLTYYTHLNSELTNEKVKILNSTISDVLAEAGRLKGEINIQKNHIKNTIDEYNKEINEFLYYAGYKYKVSIEYDDVKNYHLILKHVDSESNINLASEHLSYGEKNAFALVLFMYDVLRTNPDLVILDDPISSFDGNKKFAILNMLFMGKRCLKERTILLLTHEFSTVIDTIKTMKRKLNINTSASFLCTKEGVLSEKGISKNNIKSFIDIAKSALDSEIDILNKLIYLRRLLEVQGDKNLAYQLLSNLFHKEEKPKKKFYDEQLNRPCFIDMSDCEIEEATNHIKEYVMNFDYNIEFNKTQDNITLKNLYDNSGSNYEKMQLYRIAFNENHTSDVVRKFINETFHVENDYLFQLDPREYDTVPQYIIDECDKEMDKINY